MQTDIFKSITTDTPQELLTTTYITIEFYFITYSQFANTRFYFHDKKKKKRNNFRLTLKKFYCKKVLYCIRISFVCYCRSYYSSYSSSFVQSHRVYYIIVVYVHRGTPVFYRIRCYYYYMWFSTLYERYFNVIGRRCFFFFFLKNVCSSNFI